MGDHLRKAKAFIDRHFGPQWGQGTIHNRVVAGFLAEQFSAIATEATMRERDRCALIAEGYGETAADRAKRGPGDAFADVGAVCEANRIAIAIRASGATADTAERK